MVEGLSQWVVNSHRFEGGWQAKSAESWHCLLYRHFKDLGSRTISTRDRLSFCIPGIHKSSFTIVVPRFRATWYK